MSYRVSLPVFEGPFDLLVYLIEDARVNIYDIPIAEITGRYLSYIRAMEDLNIDVSSEFMVLAAELLRIKSMMMLPAKKRETVAAQAEDPRSGLVERIIAYKRCKARAGLLKERAEAMEDVFCKPKEDLSVYQENPGEYLSIKPEAFSRAFRAFLARKQRADEMRRRYGIVERDRRVLEERMRLLTERMRTGLKNGRKSMAFSEIAGPAEDVPERIVSFLAVLQLVRDRYLAAEQGSLYGEIMLREGSRGLNGDDEEGTAAS